MKRQTTKDFRFAGSISMLAAIFLIAIVTPLCDWSCSVTTACSSHAAASVSRLVEKQAPKPHPGCHGHSATKQSDNGGDKSSDESCKASCCPDTNGVKANSGSLLSQPLVADHSTFDIVAVLPVFADCEPPVGTSQRVRDGTRSTPPSPFLSSSLYGRAPPVVC